MLSIIVTKQVVKLKTKRSLNSLEGNIKFNNVEEVNLLFQSLKKT
jgi:hypothetical protein